MKHKVRIPDDPDLAGVGPALKWAAKAVLLLARRTNTPCYVMIDGHIVDIARKKARSKTLP